jgi:hypothetical protein
VLVVNSSFDGITGLGVAAVGCQTLRAVLE